MRILPLRNEKYEAIVAYINKIKRMGVFSKFDSSNVVIFNSKSFRGAVTFAKDLVSGNYGLSFFLGDEGLNTLYDMFMLSEESFNMASYNLTNVIYKSFDVLEPSDFSFLKSKGIEPKRINNVILNTYKEGFAMHTTTSHDADMVFEMLASLYIILTKKMGFIEEVFKNEPDKVILAEVDFENLTFQVSASDLPYLERPLKGVMAEEYEIEEFRTLDPEDYELKLMTKGCGIPVKIKECNKAITPLLVSLNMDELPLYSFDGILSLPSDYRSQIIYILKGFFVKEGLPRKLIVNNRIIYFAILDLMNSIGIECVLQMENPHYDGMLEDINIALFDGYPFSIRDQEICMVPEEDMRATFNKVKRLFNSYINDDIFSIDEEIYEDITCKRLIEIINNSMPDNEYDELEEDDLDTDGLVS